MSMDLQTIIHKRRKSYLFFRTTFTKENVKWVNDGLIDFVPKKYFSRQNLCKIKFLCTKKLNLSSISAMVKPKVMLLAWLSHLTIIPLKKFYCCCRSTSTFHLISGMIIDQYRYPKDNTEII